MSEPAKPVYLVDADSDPVMIRIDGRASFQNSGCLKEFVGTMVQRGRRRFVIDFMGCSSMDSTFLGVLAGAALDLRRQNPAGSLVVCRAGSRNLELIRNLGLHRLLTVDATGAELPASGGTPGAALVNGAVASELDQARLVLAAHENLCTADETNRAKFQDVLSFLKERVNQGGLPSS